MAFPQFKSNGAHTAPHSTDLDLPYPATVDDGDFLVAITMVGNIQTITAPSGWTLLDTLTLNITSGFYYRIADGTETGTATWTIPVATFWNAAMVSFSGVNTSSPFDETLTTTTNILSTWDVPLPSRSNSSGYDRLALANIMSGTDPNASSNVEYTRHFTSPPVMWYSMELASGDNDGVTLTKQYSSNQTSIVNLVLKPTDEVEATPGPSGVEKINDVSLADIAKYNDIDIADVNKLFN